MVDGSNLSDMDDEQLTVFRRRKIGFVFQEYNLIPELTVKENIVFPLALDDSRPDAEYLSRLVSLLGLLIIWTLIPICFPAERSNVRRLQER